MTTSRLRYEHRPRTDSWIVSDADGSVFGHVWEDADGWAFSPRLTDNRRSHDGGAYRTRSAAAHALVALKTEDPQARAERMAEHARSLEAFRSQDRCHSCGTSDPANHTIGCYA